MSLKVLFLGAGASRPFGIPTMQEMVTQLEESFSFGEMAEETLYEKIKKSQEQSYGSSKVDIESIFTVIQGIANGTKIKDMGYLPFYYISKHNLKDEFSDNNIKLAKILQKKLKEFIKKECESPLNNQEKTDAYSKSYGALFSSLPGEKGEGGYYQDWRAYTTNYDKIFEDFWADYFKLGDYFRQDGKSEHAVFDINSIPVGRLSLIKLHGSLDWVKEKSGKILKSANIGFTRQQLEEEAMLFPIQQKDLYLHPWLTLFQDLKKYLNECDEWIVIGYAFNDEFIFEIFKESFNKNKSLLMINPNGNKIKQKFPKSMQEKIVVLPIKFGDKNFPLQIKDHYLQTKDITIELITNSPSFMFNATLPVKEVLTSNQNKNGKQSEEISTNRIGWIDIPHTYDDVLRCKLILGNLPLHNKDFEIKFLTSGSYKYAITIRYHDKLLSSNKGVTKRDDKERRFSSSPIQLNTSELFL